MLDRVPAVRFVKRMEQGRTRPALVAVKDSNDAEIEVIAKFSVGCDLKAGSLVAEAVAGMLALDLGLPIPRSYLVELSGDFIETIADPEIKVRAKQSSRVCFGSRRLPAGVRAWIAGAAISEPLVLTASEIFAFDALTDNVDRRVVNSNILTNGTQIWIYDHEMAFASRLILGWKPPWVPRSRDDYRDEGRHVLYDQLRGKPVNFARFQAAWQGISDERLTGYLGAIPDEWKDDMGVSKAAIALIRSVRDNIGASLDEIARVLE